MSQETLTALADALAEALDTHPDEVVVEVPALIAALGVRGYRIALATQPAPPLDDLGTCNALAQWAAVASVSSAAGTGRLAIVKSDLLNRLISGGELGPSQTPCPVHKGTWFGCHTGWPGQEWRHIDGTVTPMEVEPRLQEWRDAGCRCSMHKGSSCTTGWNPDEHCCAALSEPKPCDFCLEGLPLDATGWHIREADPDDLGERAGGSRGSKTVVSRSSPNTREERTRKTAKCSPCSPRPAHLEGIQRIPCARP